MKYVGTPFRVLWKLATFFGLEFELRVHSTSFDHLGLTFYWEHHLAATPLHFSHTKPFVLIDSSLL